MSPFEQDSTGEWFYVYKSGREKTTMAICNQCGKQFPTRIKAPSKSCSRSCKSKYISKSQSKDHPFRKRGQDNIHWKGGKIKRRGYVFIFCPNHPSKGVTKHKDGLTKYIAEHRLVMEKYLGRYLYPEERVHHRNGIKDDNRIENLELWVHGHPYGQRIKDLPPPHCPTCSCTNRTI